MKVGEKVVCVDGFFAPEIAALYDALPIEDSVYVIRAIHEGNNYDDGKPQKCNVILLVGIVNQSPSKEGGKERGFSEKRFRPLEDLKNETRERDKDFDVVRDPETGIKFKTKDGHKILVEK